MMAYEGQPTRASLLWRLKSEQKGVREIAWHEFHDYYAPTMHRFALRMGATVEQAEDVTQEVMLGFFSATPEFVYTPSLGRFRGYLKTCVSRALLKIRKRYQVATLPDEQLEGTAADLGKIWDELWEQRLLERAVANYTASCDGNKRELFRRCVLDGESPQTVAEALGMKVDAVYKAKQRSLHEFRLVLQALTDDEP